MAPKFLSRAEVYRLIQRELPPDTYPDGPPSAFWSTADSDATAKVISTGYANLERIYENNYVQTADERLVDWEVKAFGYPLGGALSLEQRREIVLGKFRRRPTLHPDDMRELIESYIGESGDEYYWEYVEWNVVGTVSGGTPSWSLGISQLGYDTYLTGTRGVIFGEDGCDVTAEDLGLSSGDLRTIRDGAYTCELRIYEDDLPAAMKTTLQTELDRFGRASVRHLISENVSFELALDVDEGEFYMPPLGGP